jgi:hypothetical protein
MRAFATVLFVTLTLAATAPARVVHIGGEAPAALPEYGVARGASDEDVLADVRGYFDERSYAWALAAGNALAERWPESGARAESDYVRLRCLMQLSRFAELDEAFDEYFRRHEESRWAVEAVDFLVDAYSDCEKVDEDIKYREISGAWESYIWDKYEAKPLESRYKANDKIDADRREALKRCDAVYETALEREKDPASRLDLADRRVFAHVKMMASFNWNKYQRREKEYYKERKKYNERVAKFEMSDDMRSVFAFMDGLLDLFSLPPPKGAPEKRGDYDPVYRKWLDRERLKVAREKWEDVADVYGNAPGALLARAALAHYDVVYANNLDAAGKAFEELAKVSDNEEIADLVAGITENLRAPALAITAVDADLRISPPASLTLTCRGIPEVEVTVYEVDPRSYADFYRDFAVAEIEVEDMPGVGEAVERSGVATGCVEGGYGVEHVEVGFPDLPYGLYLAEARGGGELSRAAFILTGAAALTASDGSQMYLELVDASSAEPIPIADIQAQLLRYTDEGSRVVESVEPVTLGALPRGDGVTVDLSALPLKSTVFLTLDSTRGPVIHSCGTLSRESPAEGMTGEIVTDRPLYRREDKVNFKLIVREVDYVNKKMVAVPSQEVEVVMYQSWTPGVEPLWKTTGVTDEFGTFAGEFKFPAGAKLGTQTLRARWTAGGNKYYASGEFGVAEFEKPEYKLSIAKRKETYLSGERVEVDVVGWYFLDQPLARAPVSYKVLRAGETPKGFEQFDEGRVLKEGKGFLDDGGRYLIEFGTPYAGRFNNNIAVVVDVKDETERILEERLEFATVAVDRRVMVSTSQFEYGAGDEVDVRVQLFDLEHNYVAGDVHLAVYERIDHPTKMYERGELLAEYDVTLGESGMMVSKFRLEDAPGSIIIAASTPGSSGALAEDSTKISFVADVNEDEKRKGKVFVDTDRREANVGDDVKVTVSSIAKATSCLVALYSDKESLDVRRVELSPEEGFYRGSFAVAVRDKHVPRINIHPIVVADGVSYETWGAARLNVEPVGLSMAVAVDALREDFGPGEEVNVTLKCSDARSPVEADMSVAVVDEALLAMVPDKTQRVPGEFAKKFTRYADCRTSDSLRSRGDLGKVVFRFPYYDKPYGAWGGDFLPLDNEAWGPARRVVQRIYFKALFDPSLQPLFDLGIQKELKGPGWELEGRLKEAKANLRRERYVLPREIGEPLSLREGFVPGLSVGLPVYPFSPPCGASGPAPTPPIRREFLDNALWLPNLRTDEDGFALASFTLPDNLTEWRIMALTLDRGQRFGWGSASIDVSKPVVARLKAPRYFVAGDVARLTAVGHNYLDEAQELTLGLEEEGLAHVRGEASTVETVAPGERAVNYHWVQAKPAEEAEVTVSALTAAGGDAAEYKFPVYPRGSNVRQAYAGRLRDEVAHELTVAEGALPSSFAGELYLAPSLGATLSHGLDLFRDYPYDCLEQTLNRFRVNAELAAAAADLGLEETSLAEGLEDAVAAGVLKLSKAQTARNWGQPLPLAGPARRGGAWPWSRGGPESPYVSAYVLDGLHNLRDNPFVPAATAEDLERTCARAFEYLEQYLTEWRDDPDLEPAAVSLYVTDVALRVGAVAPDDFTVRKVADYYFETRPAQEPMSLALLASVLHQMGDDERLAVVMRNLDNGAQVGPDDTVYWGNAPENTWRWWDDAVETTAKVLEVKLAYQPDDPNVPKMVDWLVDQRRGAAWKSTKDSAAATLALMKYIKARPELAAPIVASYKFGTREGGLELEPTAYEEPTEKVTLAWEDVAVGDNDVRLRRQSGEGPAFYTAAVEYYVEADAIPAVQGSVTLEREYYVVEREYKKGKVKEKKKPLERPVKLGEDLEVVLKINSPYDFDYVVLEDPKPAGFIYLEAKSGYSWAAGAYVELWNKQRVLFFERLPRGETVAKYRLRAEVPGAYTALPARVYGMYSPDIGSSTASTVVEISE